MCDEAYVKYLEGALHKFIYAYYREKPSIYIPGYYDDDEEGRKKSIAARHAHAQEKADETMEKIRRRDIVIL